MPRSVSDAGTPLAKHYEAWCAGDALQRLVTPRMNSQRTREIVAEAALAIDCG